MFACRSTPENGVYAVTHKRLRTTYALVKRNAGERRVLNCRRTLENGVCTGAEKCSESDARVELLRVKSGLTEKDQCTGRDD